jgi:ribosomal protein S21
MSIEVKKGKNENTNTLLYRFTKKVQQSGVMKEVKKRRFSGRAVNKNKRKAMALYRVEKQEEIAKQKKYGYR